jgi:23S rRNA (adenine2030-N6)-methyltransferase
MNYRHAYHAGNFADVIKHAILARALAYLRRKPAPFRVIDTHAGSGRYLLSSPQAATTGEWKGGIGRLLGADAASLVPSLAAFLAPYLAAVRACNGGPPTAYPGSPAIALSLMRPHDRLIANELHPDARAELKRAIGHDRRAKIMALDGFLALKALLPPQERRGVVLIDPAFEAPHELERLAEGLQQGLRRFATGVFIAWYPIKEEKPINRFHARLAEATEKRLLRVELLVAAPAHTDRLRGCGLIIANPPYTLAAELSGALPALSRCLAGTRAAYRLDWLSDGDAGNVHAQFEQKRRVRTSG